MRNYNAKPVNKKVAKEGLLQCPSCNKKYKSDIKRQQHVEKDHYYNTRYSNHFKLSPEVRAQIYESASSYIVELYEIRKDEDYGESFAKNLLPQLSDELLSNSSEDLKRIMAAQRSFATNFLDQNLLSCDWNSVMNDLEKFFNMGLPHYDTNFCPTLAMDFLWHALMQLPDLYIEICNKSCSQIMPHCNIQRTEQEDIQRHEYFLKVFQNKFYKLPTSFPSQLEAFSIEDIHGVFIDLRNKELKVIQDRLLEIEEIKKKRDEEYRKRQVEEEERDKLQEQEKHEKRRIREERDKRQFELQEQEKEEKRRIREEREVQQFKLQRITDEENIEILRLISEDPEVPSEWLIPSNYEYYFKGYREGHRGKYLNHYALSTRKREEERAREIANFVSPLSYSTC